jgi:hypothetical protein
MVNGVRYRVTCAELGLPESEWTELGSIKAAAEWMERTLQPAPPVLDPVNQQLKTILDGMPPSELRWLARQGEEARRVLTILENASVAGQPQPDKETIPEEGISAPMPISEAATLPIPERIITSALAGDNPFYSDNDNPDELSMIGRVLDKPKVETIFTLRHHADKMLEIERARDTKAEVDCRQALHAAESRAI